MTERIRQERLAEVLEEVSPLMAPLGRAFRGMAGVFERETGVGAPRYLALAVLSRRDGVSQVEVSQAFELDPSRVTRVGQALEAEGLIRRERDPEDNRVVRMYLTDEGRKKVGEMPRLREEFQKRIGGVLSDEEVAELRRMLGLLAGAMKD